MRWFHKQEPDKVIKIDDPVISFLKIKAWKHFDYRIKQKYQTKLGEIDFVSELHMILN